MGVIVDTSVLIAFERNGQTLSPLTEIDGGAFISVVTVSELLVGVHRADSAKRQVKRTAFVETVLSQFQVLAFTMEIARVHARLYASLSIAGQIIGAHDLIIAATAVNHGLSVLTGNTSEFERVEGLTLLAP